ncbi:hypothetical protein [Paenibacillus kobensis]|uniref:hypothetical protein n=1 Tax=Paenibacillus kobensis TaxID=59841 RepID=UPI000FDB1A10|nr:hypothetical protein [Paenibacillus kobensis]
MSRIAALWTIIISQVIYVVLLLVWLFIAGMSVMMFDDPQAVNDITTWLVFIFILLYPVGVIVSIVAGWVVFARGRYKRMLIWNAIPLVWIIPLIILSVYVFS